MATTSSLLILLVAAFSVAALHAILPDHWMPIAVLARAERWSPERTFKVALLTGVGHIAGTLGLGAIPMALSMRIRSLRWC